jgi:hypothetical protein
MEKFIDGLSAAFPALSKALAPIIDELNKLFVSNGLGPLTAPGGGSGGAGGSAGGASGGGGPARGSLGSSATWGNPGSGTVSALDAMAFAPPGFGLHMTMDQYYTLSDKQAMALGMYTIDKPGFGPGPGGKETLSTKDLDALTPDQIKAMTKNPTVAQMRAWVTAAGYVPGFAKGVRNFPGGLAYVHAGEMLVNLPKGTDVIPAVKVPSYSGVDGAALDTSAIVEQLASSNERLARIEAHLADAPERTGAALQEPVVTVAGAVVTGRAVQAQRSHKRAVRGGSKSTDLFGHLAGGR